ncbi:MAG: hypothetical protein IMF26_09705 [Candidatus Fermentithermobacillus carboniphilus]|uniref:DUF6754 domain-containing protein n=1 Tax=Candidatus Fermentithermobacillus carboniphilus TaxID=3085328 RepID=A0AAT9LD96_9FIRM|nr:MAG: hypothetical protein IMF26_09705 [Candidatus Fermentithermobacillus carboniphilus]
MTLAKGRVFSFWLLVVIIGCLLYSMWRAKKGRPISIRKIAGLDAIEEAIGRSTEMGRPVHYCPGIGGIGAVEAPQTFAGLAIMSHVARLTAKFDVPIIVTVRQPEVFPMAEETVRQAYLEEGKGDAYEPTNIRFLSSQQFAYAAALFGIMAREKPAANFMMGAFWAEALMLAEVGSEVGALQITGTAQLSQVPFFVASSDYTLIGEELFAAAAYLSRDQMQLGSILGQDLAKAIVALLIIIGVLTTSAGSDYLSKLMRK